MPYTTNPAPPKVEDLLLTDAANEDFTFDPLWNDYRPCSYAGVTPKWYPGGGKAPYYTQLTNGPLPWPGADCVWQTSNSFYFEYMISFPGWQPNWKLKEKSDILIAPSTDKNVLTQPFPPPAGSQYTVLDWRAPNKWRLLSCHLIPGYCFLWACNKDTVFEVPGGSVSFNGVWITLRPDPGPQEP